MLRLFPGAGTPIRPAGTFPKSITKLPLHYPLLLHLTDDPSLNLSIASDDVSILWIVLAFPVRIPRFVLAS